MEVPTATWSVVQFVEDKSVEAVPTNWLDGDQCYWPPLRKAKLNNAIRKLETPQPTWIKLTVKCFRNGIFKTTKIFEVVTFGDSPCIMLLDDYAKARKEAKEAEETSNLQSEVDKSGVPRKRKIYRPSWATSSEDLCSDDTMLPTPPSFESEPKIFTVTSKESPSLLKRNRPFERRQHAEEEPESFSTIENPGTSQLGNNSSKVEEYCKSILEQQHLLRSLLTEVLARVSRLEEKCNEHSAPEQGSPSIFKQSIVFPINCEEELQKLETYLQYENNFRDAVNELATIGGANIYNFVKRVMACLITNGLATQYSWLGRKGKKIFHNLKLAKIIIDAAEKTGLCKSKKETEISIQSWLRRATERGRLIVKDM